MRIAGVDEAGRGPLAGPVVAAAVVFPHGYENPEIKDSKALSAAARGRLAETIKRDALGWAIVAVGHHRITSKNILRASLTAMSLALDRIEADMVLVDGNMPIPTRVRQETVVGGDALHVQISAASILAKTWRDHLMGLLDKKYPGYGFASHFGYATPQHREAIEALGPSRVHRITFSGVREYFPQPQLVLEGLSIGNES